VHGLLSSQLTVPVQTPLTHLSAVVQDLPSSQFLPSFVGVCRHSPFAGLQESAVHEFASSQFLAVPLQVLPWHLSSTVQRSLSLQGSVQTLEVPSIPKVIFEPPIGVWMQPWIGSQESEVEGFPSSQLNAVVPGWQAPPEHVSPTVHALPSLHGSALLANTQPEAGSHESVVHGFPLSQPIVGPGMHLPDWHASPSVHALPSSHEVPSAMFSSPHVPSLQTGSVQASPPGQSASVSQHPAIGVPWHWPSMH